MRNTNELTYDETDLMHFVGTGPAPEGGESCQFRDFRRGSGNFITVPFTSWGDYGGSTVERSNCRVILELFSDDVIHIITGDYGSEALVLPLGVEIPDEFFDGIEALHEYPAWDEMDLVDLESDLADEEWDRSGAYDLKTALVKILSDGSAAGDYDAACMVPDGGELWDLYRAVADELDVYPYCEDAVSAVLWRDSDGLPDAVADRILAAWCHRPEIEGQLPMFD